MRAVTIVDGAKMEYTNIYQLTTIKPVVLVNVKLHVLADGFRYCTARRKVILTPSQNRVAEAPEEIQRASS